MSARVRHLRAPPIVEALVRLVASPPLALTPEFAAEFQKALADDYPRVDHRKSWQHSFLVRQGENPTVLPQGGAVRPDALRFTSADGKHVAFFGEEGYSFSRLHPYEGWGPFIAEARRGWDVGKGFLSSGQLVGLGLRFINAIEVPMPVRDVGQYLVSPPAISETIVDTVSAFLSRVLFEDPQTGATVSFTQTTGGPTNPTTGKLVLDIEVSRTWPTEKTDDEVWLALDQFRELKNRVFFQSVTDKLLERYE